MTTVCANCQHLSLSGSIWYDQHCLASPLPTKLDPASGKILAYEINDLGRPIFTQDRFKYCRDVNTGECQKFEVRA